MPLPARSEALPMQSTPWCPHPKISVLRPRHKTHTWMIMIMMRKKKIIKGGGVPPSSSCSGVKHKVKVVVVVVVEHQLGSFWSL
jgi:hypothetical protein